MRLRTPLLLLAVLALAPTAFAQAPLLEVTTLNSQTALKNVHNAPATAWVVQFNWRQRDGAVLTMAFGQDKLAVIPFGPNTPIQPGGTVPWDRPVRDATGQRVIAVVYADGTTAGDPAVVRRLLDARQFAYQDIAEDLRLLTDIAVQAAPDLKQLLAQFEERRKRHNAELAALLPVPPLPPGAEADTFCRMIIDMLNRELKARKMRPAATDNVPLIAFINKAGLTGWYDRLAESKPRLAPVNGPAPWRSATTVAHGSIPLLDGQWDAVRSQTGRFLYAIRLKNNYAAAATAWAYDVLAADSTMLRSTTTDHVAEPRLSVIASGATTSAGGGSVDRELAGVRMTAVIYNDGAMAGDQQQLNLLLAMRKLLFRAVPGALGMTRKALTQEQPDRQALAAAFQSCEQRNVDQRKTAGFRPYDSVCAPVAAALRSSPDSTYMVLTSQAKRLQDLYDALKSSKPALE